MLILKKCTNSTTCSCYTTAATSYLLLTPIILLLLLNTLQSEVEGGATIPSNGVMQMQSPVWNQEDKVCGTVHTMTGDRVLLREGVTLAPEEFEKIHVQKLKNSIFSLDKKCVIQVCGFTSWGTRINNSYIGSNSDYADCLQILEETTASHEIFNDVYNTSSISCGCYKAQEECIQTCKDRANSLKGSWKGNDCAILYQENACKACYLNPIKLSNRQNYSTDNSHHILSMVVRDNCTVYQNSSALKQMYKFANVAQPIVYKSGPSENKVSNAFQNDPESFSCDCDSYPPHPPGPTPPTATIPPHSDSFLIIATIGYIIGGVGIFLVVAFICVGVAVLKSKRWRIVKTTDKSEGGYTETTVSNVSQYPTEPSILKKEDDYSTGSEYMYDDDPNLFGKDDDDEIVDVQFNTAFQVSPEQFELHEALNSGNFGQVSAGIMRVAIKTAKESNIAIRSLQQEIKILSYLGSHENVVRLLGAHVGDYRKGELFLIMEFCKNGSLESYLRSTVKPRIQGILCRRALERLRHTKEVDGYPEQVSNMDIDNPNNWEMDVENDLEKLDPEMLRLIYQWCSEISCGMLYIQSKNIVHVDLATRNVMLSANLTAKIGDFGLSKKIYINNYACNRKDSLPIRWIAPEALKFKRCTAKSDVWSFAVTVWEILELGKIPYGHLDWTLAAAAVMNGEHLDCPKYATEDVYLKMTECWNMTPNERPSFDELEKFFELKMLQIELPTGESLHQVGGDMTSSLEDGSMDSGPV